MVYIWYLLPKYQYTARDVKTVKHIIKFLKENGVDLSKITYFNNLRKNSNKNWKTPLELLKKEGFSPKLSWVVAP